MRVYKEFTFEAAHLLPSAPSGHPNARVRDIPSRVRLAAAGEPSDAQGVVTHLDALEAGMAAVRAALDHRFLNDIEGLAAPTLEHIAMWLWDRLHNRLPGLAE